MAAARLACSFRTVNTPSKPTLSPFRTFNVNTKRGFHCSTPLRVSVMDPTEWNTKVISESHKKPVLVDFYADWCGPCRALGPKIEKMQTLYGDKVEFYKLNVDNEDGQNIFEELRISSIPDVVIFRNGKVVQRFKGNIDEPSLINTIDKSLSV